MMGVWWGDCGGDSGGECGREDVVWWEAWVVSECCGWRGEVWG